MAEFVPCQSCSKNVNRLLEVCPYCGMDPGGDRSDATSAAPPIAPPGSSDIYRPIEGVAVFVQLLLGLVAIASVVGLATGSGYRSALLDIGAGRSGLMSDALLAEQRYIAVANVLSVVSIVLAASWIVWQWRAYANLTALNRPRMRKAGWAIGGWFVPIGNLFIPYGIGAEIWTQSIPAKDPPRTRRDPNLEPVISWWALFLIMTAVNQIALFIALDAGDDPTQLASVVGIEMVSRVVAIAAAVTAIRFVRLATGRQEALARLVGSVPGG